MSRWQGVLIAGALMVFAAGCSQSSSKAPSPSPQSASLPPIALPAPPESIGSVADAEVEVEKDPTPKNRLKLAFAHYKARSFSTAAEHFQPLMQEAEVKKAAIFGYAYSLVGLEKYAEGAQWLHVLAKQGLSKNSRADTLHNVGKLYWHLRRVDEAQEMFEQSIDLNPTNAEAHLGAGLCYAYNRRFSEATSSFLEGAALAKTDSLKARALTYAALSEEDAGRAANGKKYYKQARSLDRTSADSIYQDFWKSKKKE